MSEPLKKRFQDDIVALSEVRKYFIFIIVFLLRPFPSLQILEDQPDRWFENPCGWLSRPSYKRDAQKKRSVDRRSSFSGFSLQKLMTGSAYKRRWFVLDEQDKKLKYYRDETARSETGFVDLSVVIEVQPSVVFDAPANSFDLVSHDRYYTISASTREMMIKWAFAIQRILKIMTISTLNKGSNALISSSAAGSALLGGEEEEIEKAEDQRWYRYDFTYQNRGPLMLNVVGKANKDKDGNIASYSIIGK